MTFHGYKRNIELSLFPYFSSIGMQKIASCSIAFIACYHFNLLQKPTITIVLVHIQIDFFL